MVISYSATITGPNTITFNNNTTNAIPNSPRTRTVAAAILCDNTTITNNTKINRNTCFIACSGGESSESEDDEDKENWPWPWRRFTRSPAPEPE
ncbi:hypothetical protein BG003_005375 [Podila horticola]|nr:hypothetical protein BG003_005375 [Podila horticola]